MKIVDEVVRGRHGGIPVRRYGDGPTGLVWLHGGGFSYGDLHMPESDAVARALAAVGQCVIAVDYRLAPRWSWIREPQPGTLPGIRYPVPLDDVVDVISLVGSERALAVGGASAGACLAAAAALRLRDEGTSQIERLVLAYGTFHAALPPISEALSARLRGRHGLLQFRYRTVHQMNRNYAGSADAMDASYAFPGGKPLVGLPPTLVLDADRDSLRSSGEAFAGELASAGVPVRHAVITGSRHGFFNRPGRPEFAEAIASVTRFLEARRPAE